MILERLIEAPNFVRQPGPGKRKNSTAAWARPWSKYQFAEIAGPTLISYRFGRQSPSTS